MVNQQNGQHNIQLNPQTQSQRLNQQNLQYNNQLNPQTQPQLANQQNNRRLNQTNSQNGIMNRSKNSRPDRNEQGLFTKINVEMILTKRIHDLDFLRILREFRSNSNDWTNKGQITAIVGHISDECFDKLYYLYENRSQRDLNAAIYDRPDSNPNNNRQSTSNPDNTKKIRRGKKRRMLHESRNGTTKRLIQKVEQLQDDKLKDANEKLNNCQKLLDNAQKELEMVKQKLADTESKYEEFRNNTAVVRAEKLIYRNRLLAINNDVNIENSEVVKQLENMGCLGRSGLNDVTGKLLG